MKIKKSYFLIFLVLIAKSAKQEDLKTIENAKFDNRNGDIKCIQCDLSNTSELKGKKLWGGKFNGSDFSNSDLTGTEFDGATLENVDFTNAILDNATFTGSFMYNANFTGASAKNTNFKISTNCKSNPEVSTRSNTNEKKICKTTFKNTNLEGASFNNSRHKNSDYTNANLNKVNFLYSNQKGSNFLNTKTENAIFGATILCNVKNIHTISDKTGLKKKYVNSKLGGGFMEMSPYWCTSQPLGLARKADLTKDAHSEDALLLWEFVNN